MALVMHFLKTFIGLSVRGFAVTFVRPCLFTASLLRLFNASWGVESYDYNCPHS